MELRLYRIKWETANSSGYGVVIATNQYNAKQKVMEADPSIFFHTLEVEEFDITKAHLFHA